VDRAQDWGSHIIEHELSALYDVAHGAGLAVVFPAWMRYVFQHDMRRFAQYAIRVWNCEYSLDLESVCKEGIARTKQFFSSIGMPVNFKELDAKPEDIDKLAGNADFNPEGTVGNFVKLNLADIVAILKIAAE
jgi:alcohol dehydrogenase YqhD (iron-dependent ADH family)